MSCGNCVNTVGAALSGIAGVEEVSVDLDSHQAKVTVNNHDITARMLIEAIRLAGYEAVEAE